ncbi:hypothetical protein [Nitrosomonas mobilis]|uniref:Uncharacterized protein n=1 Tax=Nitrosomonas mobilis TaxID=51642 RepID=A0A1G5SFZ1_9PROT|nr:hypothetical protein [Nitrosomonas mobilis]SCZ86113.1 hypothetical protein NSMM_490002 [Nitrosomonas mobilis]
MQTFYFHPEVAPDMRKSVVWYENPLLILPANVSKALMQAYQSLATNW